MICQLICILVYDQICINALKSKDGDSSTCTGTISVDWFNSILNYILIIINVLSCSCLHAEKTSTALSGPGQSNAANPTIFATRVFIAFVIAFQLSLCLFIADCVGVSIVWCSMFGWLFMCMQTFSSSQTRIQSVSIITAPTQSTLAKTVALLDCGVIVFYAVVSDIISTIAHCLAIVMGVVLWKVATWSTNYYSNKTKTR